MAGLATGRKFDFSNVVNLIFVNFHSPYGSDALNVSANDVLLLLSGQTFEEVIEQLVVNNVVAGREEVAQSNDCPFANSLSR